MSAPKLLMLVTEDWYFVSHRLSLARSAMLAGYDVTVVTGVGDMGARISEAGVRLIPFRFDRRGMNALRELATVVRLVRLLRRERPEIVHNVSLKPVVLGGLACRLGGIERVVSAITGMGFLFTEQQRAPAVSKLVRGLLARIGRRGVMVVQNRDDARLLVSSGVPEERIKLIPGVGVDLDAFRRMPEPDGVPVAALPARMLRDKGVFEFVEAARILRGRNVPVRCVLVGAPDDGNPTSIPTDTLKEWVAEGAVEWWGHSDDMPHTLGNSSIVCLPSYREGFPKVLAEAASCGRAIVATDVPGCRDIVRHRENGLLVQARDGVQLALAIEELACNRSLRTKMGDAGRRLAEQEFSVAAATQRTLDVYAELLRSGGA